MATENVNGLKYQGHLLTNQQNSILYNGEIVNEVRFNGTKIWRREPHVLVRNRHDLRNVNIWDAYFRSLNAGVQDYYITFDNCSIGSMTTQLWAMRTGDFPKGSRLFIRLQNNAWVCGKGGNGASVGRLKEYVSRPEAERDIPKYTGNMEHFISLGDAGMGGNCFWNDAGIFVHIYLYAEGSSSNTGHIGAGGGGGGAMVAFYQSKNVITYRSSSNFTGRQSTTYGAYGGCAGAGIPAGEVGSGDCGTPHPSANEVDLRAAVSSTIWVGRVDERIGRIIKQNGYAPVQSGNHYYEGGRRPDNLAYPSLEGEGESIPNMWQGGFGGDLGQDGHHTKFGGLNYGLPLTDWRNPKGAIRVFGGQKLGSQTQVTGKYRSSRFYSNYGGEAGMMMGAPSGLGNRVTIHHKPLSNPFDIRKFIAHGQSRVGQSYKVDSGDGTGASPFMHFLCESELDYVGVKGARIPRQPPEFGEWFNTVNSSILVNGHPYNTETQGLYFYVYKTGIIARYHSNLNVALGASPSDVVTVGGKNISNGGRFYVEIFTEEKHGKYVVTMQNNSGHLILERESTDAHAIYDQLKHAQNKEVFVKFSPT